MAPLLLLQVAGLAIVSTGDGKFHAWRLADGAIIHTYHAQESYGVLPTDIGGGRLATLSKFGVAVRIHVSPQSYLPRLCAVSTRPVA